MVGRTLFYGQTDGMLYRRSFDGVSFGDPAPVNPYLDPLWNTVETGSGPVGQTYAGVLPTWYTQLSTVTGMFYANGRIYYTRSGQNSLFWRWFSPDSGSHRRHREHGDRRQHHLEQHQGDVPRRQQPLRRQLDQRPAARRSASSTEHRPAPRRWPTRRGTGAARRCSSPPCCPTSRRRPPSPPTARASRAPSTGPASTDSDGTVQSYEWTFSDGEEAGGPNPQKDFSDTGTYDVTLTVTDNGGLTSSTTQQVSVVKPNVPPTADFTTTCDYLACHFDASTSADTDGTVDDYAWDFGDGQTGTGSVTDHVYEHPGAYTISLVVTDDDLATDDASTSRDLVAAPAPSTVSYVGGAVNQGNIATPNVTTPTTVSAGDRLLMVLTVNASTRVLSAPTGVTGWTVLGTTTSGSMQTRVYTKIADAADANTKVTVALDAAAKYTMTVADYSGSVPATSSMPTSPRR